MKWLAIILVVVMLFSAVALLGKNNGFFEKEETPTETVETNVGTDTGKDTGDDTSNVVVPEPEPVPASTWTEVECIVTEEAAGEYLYKYKITPGKVYAFYTTAETYDLYELRSGFEYYPTDPNGDEVIVGGYIYLLATEYQGVIYAEFDGLESGNLFEFTYTEPAADEWVTYTQDHDRLDFALEDNQFYLIKVTAQEALNDLIAFEEDENCSREYSFYAVETVSDNEKVYFGGGLFLSDCNNIYYYYLDDGLDDWYLTKYPVTISVCKVSFPPAEE